MPDRMGSGTLSAFLSRTFAHQMKRALLGLCLLSPATWACDHHLPLADVVSVTTCSPSEDSVDCVYSGRALHDYMDAVPDTDADFILGLQASPWRMYDAEWRILTPDDIAASVRAQRDAKVKRVELLGSWTGVSPEPGVSSLADRVSKALDGFPVQGEAGFLWLSKDGSRRTTRQAYTVREGAGAYYLPEGADVFAALAAGWPTYVEDEIAGTDLTLLTQAAAGWDVMFLCPDKALAGFERAAAKGSAIAAYNAALMRLERGGDAERAAALALLERAAALGDDPSRARLTLERAQR
ncbi:hypothetical protein VDQ83_08425 [Xanthomonas campestris pv. campestris]|nr:hypothetical protein [Xanthomonas campestris pv. campestris]